MSERALARRVTLVASAAALTALAAAGCTSPSGTAAASTPASPATESPTAVGPSATAPAPAAVEPAAAKPQATAPPTGKLIDMGSVRFWDGAPLAVPAGACPAATVRFNPRTFTSTVKGVEYRTYGENGFTIGDLTGDGRKEAIVALDCGQAKQMIVVVTATGPKSYQTIATGRVVDTYTKYMEVKGGALLTYDVAYPRSASKQVRTWKISGGVLKQVAVTAPPIDLRNATVAMPRLGSCPAGTYTFRDGTTATRLTPDHDPVLTMPKDAAVYYDDFDGNNVRDSLTRIRCSIGWPSADSVVALTPTGATSARALGVVATAAPDALERISGYEVDRGSVRVVIDKAPGTKPSTVDYRWTKNGFRKI